MRHGSTPCGDFTWHEAPLRLKSEDEEQAVYPGTVIYDRPATISPKANASWSQMPMGNGNISISVWFEAPQDLVFYVGKSDSYDELHNLVKERPRVESEAAATSRNNTF